MQSPSLARVHTLEDVITAMYRSCLTTVSAEITAVTSSFFEVTGVFDNFIFTDNPANSLEKRLLVGGIEHKKAVLQSSTVVRIPKTSGFTPILSDIVEVKDISPFYYIGTPKELNLVELKQPAFALFTPNNETMGGGNGSTITKSTQVTICLSDFSKDFGWTDKFTGALNEMTQPKFAQYILRPLELFATKFVMLLSDSYEYKPAGSDLRTTVRYANQDRRARFTTVRRLGRDDGKDVKAGFGYAENTSGIIIQMDIILENSICVQN